MEYFPSILIPSEIHRAKSAEPSIPQFKELAPTAPGPHPKKIEIAGITLGTWLAFPSMGIATWVGGFNSGVIVLLGAMVALSVYLWKQVKTYPVRQRKHAAEVSSYPKRFEAFKQRKHKHQEEVQLAMRPERIADFRALQLRQTLKRTIPPDGRGSRAQRGRAEEQFAQLLKRNFLGKIHTGLTLKIPGYDYPYTPDIAYIDEVLNLHIDIEIDEPYVYETVQPTHYLNGDKDTRRNTFFLERGWVVIRFSEEQVMKSGQSCCREVAQVIAALLGEETVLIPFQKVAPLTPVKRWSEQEAIQMAEKKIR